MWTIVSSNHRQQARFNGSSTIEWTSPSTNIMNASIFGVIIVAVLVIFIVAALVTPVANLTTGVTVSHAGGPAVNPNITQTPGLAPVLQLYPLFFIFIGLLYVAKVASEETRSI